MYGSLHGPEADSHPTLPPGQSQEVDSEQAAISAPLYIRGLGPRGQVGGAGAPGTVDTRYTEILYGLELRLASF